MAYESGGYEAEFLEEPSDSLVCPICLNALREPQLVSCCGRHFCRLCIAKVIQDDEPCPHCRSQDYSLMLNKGVEREVKSLRVRCKHSQRQCSWKGELRQLGSHLCPHEDVRCRNDGCGVTVERRFLEKHETEECVRRPTRCSHCDNFEAAYEEVQGHWKVCKRFPVSCPSRCSETANIPRGDIEAHLVHCPNQPVPCEYRIVGCTANPVRRDLATHMDTALQAHNYLLLQQVLTLSRQLTTLGRENQSLRDDLTQLREDADARHFLALPLSFTIVNFDQLKLQALPWWSAPFYTHPCGYKMKIVVYPRGHLTRTHVSLYCHLMKGEFDEELQWPFCGKVFIELLNQASDDNHLSSTIDFSTVAETFGAARVENTAQRVRTGDCQRGFGVQLLISHKLLDNPATADTVYIVNKTRVDFRVSRIEIH